MLRFLLGVAIPVVGTVWGFTHAGGRLISLLHTSEMAVVLGFIVGGVVMAFGALDPCKMFLSALDLNSDRSPEQLRRNILICEGASKFSLYGGFTACFLGIIIITGAISLDASIVGEKFGAALTGLVLGAGWAGVVFQPLKFRFLGQLSELEAADQAKKEASDEKSLS